VIASVCVRSDGCRVDVGAWAATTSVRCVDILESDSMVSFALDVKCTSVKFRNRPPVQCLLEAPLCCCLSRGFVQCSVLDDDDDDDDDDGSVG
jgi:hypothetical protein